MVWGSTVDLIWLSVEKEEKNVYSAFWAGLGQNLVWTTVRIDG